MSLHLVTGYAGQAHIKAANHGAYNAAVVGSGKYVLDSGNMMAASVLSANKIRIYDGICLNQGRHIQIDPDTYEEVDIENGTQGYMRNDIIVMRYSKDAETDIESASLVVIKGTPAEVSPTDPEHAEGSILNGALVDDMPLYRVPLDGLTVGELVPLFEIMPSMGAMVESLSEVKESAEAANSTASSAKTTASSALTKANAAMPKTGGTFTGVISVPRNMFIIQTSSTAESYVQLNHPLKTGVCTISGQGNFGLYDKTKSKWLIRADTSGTVTGSSSDRREKKDIEYMTDEDALAIIQSLKPCSFKYKDDEIGIQRTGIIAQDVVDYLKENDKESYGAIRIFKNPGIDEVQITDIYEPEANVKYAIDYDDYIMPMAKVIQYLLNKVDKLEERLNKTE